MIKNSSIDLFVMSGQSNMQGQSEGPAQSPLLDPAAAMEYKYLSNALVPLRHPVGEDILDDSTREELLLGAHQGFGNLVPAFAKAYYDTSFRKACYSHCAKGNTVIAQWLKGTPRYQALINKAQKASQCLLQEGYQIGKRIMVWLQGESDGILHTSKEDYLHMLRTFWQDVRAELALDAFLIIRFAQFGDFPCFPVMLAQEEFCREEENAILLTRITGTFTIENGLMQGETAPFHYTNKGYDLVGKTAGTNAAKWIQGLPFSLEPECYDFIENK